MYVKHFPWCFFVFLEYVLIRIENDITRCDIKNNPLISPKPHVMFVAMFIGICKYKTKTTPVAEKWACVVNWCYAL